MSTIRCLSTKANLVVVAFVFAGCTPSPMESEGAQNNRQPPIAEAISAPVVLDDLHASFERAATSDIVYALNEVKQSPIDFDVIQAVSCAYSKCTVGSDRWQWDVLSKPLVRANLIDVLLQANGRGIETIDPTELKSGLVELLSEPNPQVVQQCLLALSYLDDRSDVPIISKVATETTNVTTFRVAVLALTSMTGSESESAIANLIREATTEENDAVADLLEGMEK